VAGGTSDEESRRSVGISGRTPADLAAVSDETATTDK